MPTSQRRSWPTVVAILILAVCTVVGVILIVTGSREESSAAAAAPMPAQDYDTTEAADPVTAALPSIDPTLGATETAAHSPADQPDQREQVPDGPLLDERLVIPALGVNAEIRSNPLVDGSLELPEQVNTLTLWDGSADITAATGTMLVAGHVDNRVQGPGALYWLHTLQPGDALYLTHAGVVTRWKTVALQSYVKQALPQDIWVGAEGPRTLVVVTCGGNFENGNYDNNVVLTAVPF